VRQLAERASVNTPIQGSAADLIKLSMIGIDAGLSERGLSADMVLQVHDELVFEVDEGALSDVAELVTGQMERPGGMTLSVPLVVNVGHGRSWFEAH
jgi:DNA polymerase-1